MTDIPDPAVPLSALLSRIANHIEATREAQASLRWWQLRRRFILAGALSAYRLEHQAALELGGAYAMHVLRGQ